VYSKFLEDYLAILKRTSVGQPYVPFSMADSAGVEIALAGLTGTNYLLVDFWASWCSPCREENPNLVALYNEYHEKGFDIFGVSFDSRRERWLQAIADDQLTWTHVSDLKGWENAAGKLYGIRSIPSNVLLDPNGVIIARNLRGEDLRNKLKEIFDTLAN
jgi:peroxiredoxin